MSLLLRMSGNYYFCVILSYCHVMEICRAMTDLTSKRVLFEVVFMLMFLLVLGISNEYTASFIMSRNTVYPFLIVANDFMGALQSFSDSSMMKSINFRVLVAVDIFFSLRSLKKSLNDLSRYSFRSCEFRSCEP